MFNESGFELNFGGRDIAPDQNVDFDFAGITPGSYIVSAIYAREGKGVLRPASESTSGTPT